MNRKELGKRGESAAARYLLEQGYQLLESNLRGPRGEADLVLLDGDTLVFCEVKTKVSELSGHAAEGYRPKQQTRLRTVILKYLQRHEWDGPIRVDVVALQKEPDSSLYSVHHYKDAVSLQDTW